MILSKEQLLKVSKRSFVTIQVPELDGEVRLASLSAGTALKYTDLQARQKKGEQVSRELMLLVVETSIVDENGNPLFDNASAAAFLDRVGLETITLIMTSVPTPKPPSGVTVDVGNSEASPATH